MKRLNKVLIPLDDSEFSLSVVPSVTKLLAPEQTELFLLHVVPEPEAVTMDELQPSMVSAELAVYSDQAEEAIREQYGETVHPLVESLEKMGYQVTPVVSFGKPATQIERVVRDRDIDLIAMTTHGREGMARLLHGSIAQDILHHLYVPVLLLREEPEDWLGGAIGE